MVDTVAAVLLSLSTGNKIGLATAAAIFVAFSLVAAFVAPRKNPAFPGRRGLTVFLVITAVLFVMMLTAVEIFGVEEETPEHEAAATTAATYAISHG